MIVITGWFVTFILGVLSAVIVLRLTRKRKVVAWASLSENEIVPKQLSETLRIPVVLLVGSEKPASLSTVQVRIGSGGNEPIERLEISISFNPGGLILNVRALDDLGEYGKHVAWIPDQNVCRLKLDFLNPGTILDMEFLVSDHESGSLDVDLAAPGVELIRRRAPTIWDAIVPISLKGIGLDLMGVRYDPSVESLNHIAAELKSIRRQIGGK